MHFLVTVAVLVFAPPSGGAGARRDEATAALVAAERARGAEVVEDPVAAVEAGWTAERNLGFFARAAALVGEGRRALVRVELEAAEAKLGAAEALYANERGRAGVSAEAAEAAKWHGVALFELKRRDEAVAAWRRARALEPRTQLDESMVRPEVARAFAAVPIEPGGPAARRLANVSALRERPDGAELASLEEVLGLDGVVVAAIAIDDGRLTYAATLRRPGCGSDVLTATRAGELVRRLDEAPCRTDASLAVLDAPAIAHPRAARVGAIGAGASGGGGAERRARLWQRPWLWVGVVGALGVGVVLAASLWPRDASYSATLDFHAFALGQR